MDWNITCLTYGKEEIPKSVATINLDHEIKMWMPFLGFLLQNGSRNILVDTGIHNRLVVDGKGWGDLPAEGGEQYVLAELEDASVSPQDIEMVVYTHLHLDHAGNCHLFPEAKHIFQKDEWFKLLEPLPHEKIRGDYDSAIIPELQRLDTLMVTGNFQIVPGITCYRTPGHTAGSMSLTIDTIKGTYVLTGDTVMFKCNMYPQMDKMTLMDGTEINITPVPKSIGPAIPTMLINDFYGWLDSIYLLKSLCQSPAFLLAGHDPSLTNKVFP